MVDILALASSLNVRCLNLFSSSSYWYPVGPSSYWNPEDLVSAITIDIIVLFL
jgi:hypothetical protein